MEIVVAVITGTLSLAGTVITVLATSSKARADMRVAQAITDTKITELTREVRYHNEFAKRMPLLEDKVSRLERQAEKQAEKEKK